MLRLSHYLKQIHGGANAPARKTPMINRDSPVVIWNLIRRCNLTCRHCYSTSTDTDFAGELNTAEAHNVIDQLNEAGVRVLILSGGEPLLRPDVFELADHARELGFYVALSTNGTLIEEHNLPHIAAAQFDYVGISLDGLRDTHTYMRRDPSAYDKSLRAIALCRSAGIKVGLRTTLNQHNAAELPALLDLMHELDVQKFYLSHLNYSGRGKHHRKQDAQLRMTREAVDLLIARAWDDICQGRNTEYVTGNNDADAVRLLDWAQTHRPDDYDKLLTMLTRWGGNATGSSIANIDNLGEVHPDTYWWHYSVGNVRKRSFKDIWFDNPDVLLTELRRRPRPLGGRCGACQWLAVCGGNTRTRAWATSGELWAEDPGCYLTDQEIGLEQKRITTHSA
ncbi:heme d1 biosynthesis radical SAM protein NirJ [Atopomonas sediminilitoris]|uniref:heme d1 biosynthesis radical SAM protein NirJ n=1 Tax=Atopomonas sediminilitoris TaxID=2919919 RepID=UPI001F4ED7C5|nr:heme d1 biosynthesis radical SAM protein NirJ [Atopomonas sediminilitoris]MCJ8170848.1 heme d1 biosynthesis radical SAM protein NirJ [Atopomonas sediminilitoris]